MPEDRSENKSKKRRFVYVDVSPHHIPDFSDFFGDREPSKKEELDQFMDENPHGVDYRLLMKKLKELERK